MDESGIFATISLTIRRANVIVNTDPTTERVDYDLDKGPAGRDDVEGDDLNYDTRSGRCLAAVPSGAGSHELSEWAVCTVSRRNY
jgi:hypothetical protein